MSTQGIQGHDTMPLQIGKNFAKLFSDHLPGWSINGEYNFAATASTQMTSAQLKLLMHSGSHPWINDAIAALLRSEKFVELSETEKPRYLASLVNFMAETSGDAAITSNGKKTAGFVAFTNRNDPHLLEKLGGKPSVEEMRAYAKKYLDWDVIMKSEAAEDIARLNVRVENKKLIYDGHLDNGSFFSKPSSDLDKWTEYKNSPPKPFESPSTQFSKKYVETHGIKAISGGAVAVKGVPQNYQEALDLLNKELPGGSLIRDFNKLPNTLLKKVGGAILSLAVVLVLSTSAQAAQSQPDYDSSHVVPANKELIVEIFATAIGGLAGTVGGMLTTAAGLGFLALPATIGAGVIGDKVGREIGSFFYDAFPDLANAAAEWIAPLLAPAGAIINDAVDVILELVSDAFGYVSDLIEGVDGLFGLEGPLFGSDGPLHSALEYVQRLGFLKEGGEWNFASFDADILGKDGTDWLIHDGWGVVKGNAGDDALIGVNPDHLDPGDALFAEPESPVARQEEKLTLDGGAGNDWVIALGGEKAVTIGGNGRDWIFNTSAGGVIYGDTVDGRSPDGSDLNGKDNSDNMWWWHDVTLMDARPNDVLKFFGVPLTGGQQGLPLIVTGTLFGANALMGPVYSINQSVGGMVPLYFDNFVPFITYVMKDKDLYVVDAFSAIAGLISNFYTGKDAPPSGAMRIKDFDFQSSAWGAVLAAKTLEGKTGDLGMLFKDANLFLAAVALLPPMMGSWLLPMIDELLNLAQAALRFLKAANWSLNVDPLVLDLDGDGIETVALGDQKLYFDVDGDFFAERSGWLKGDDGFLTYDRNGNGRIDDTFEMFGTRTNSGFGDLAALDSNKDGAITAADWEFARLTVWQDLDQDGITDVGELKTLSQLAITRIDLAGAKAINVTTPQGTELRAESTFTRADGYKGAILEAVFAVNDIDTVYRGEKGLAPWVAAAGLKAKGFGQVADLGVVMSNDAVIAAEAAKVAAAMTVPNLKTMVGQVGNLLGLWAESLDLTRELTPVLTRIVNGQAQLMDRGIYVEDAKGGYWTLASGAAVKAANGTVIARPTLEQVMAQAASGGAQWSLEQMFSPVTRTEAVTLRTTKPQGPRRSSGPLRLAA